MSAPEAERILAVVLAPPGPPRGPGGSLQPLAGKKLATWSFSRAGVGPGLGKAMVGLLLMAAGVAILRRGGTSLPALPVAPALAVLAAGERADRVTRSAAGMEHGWLAERQAAAGRTGP